MHLYFFFSHAGRRRQEKAATFVHQLDHMPVRHSAPLPRNSNTVTLVCLTGFLAIPSITSSVHGNFLLFPFFFEQRIEFVPSIEALGKQKQKIALYALREAFCLTSISIVAPLRRRPTLLLFDAHISVPPQPLNFRDSPRRLS